MHKIIVTGPINSGKTTVTKMFHKKGYMIFNADQEAKEIITKNKSVIKKLIKIFGDGIMRNNTVSLNKLKSIFLKSKENKKLIDEIIHPIFYSNLNRLVKNYNKKNIVIEIPLIETLNASNFKSDIIFISSTYEKRLQRYLINTNHKSQTFETINKMQASNIFYKKNSDYILINNDTIDSLKKRFDNLYRVFENG